MKRPPRSSSARSFFLLLLALFTLGTLARSALAQPGDIARSLAAEVGVVGNMGEPNRSGFAESVKCRVRPQDEVWVIGTRHLGWPTCEENPPPLKFWRWDCDIDNWHKLSAKEFKASESATVATYFYLHGNRVDSWTAIDYGWYAYDAIVRRGDNDRPVRYVIYSWPSTRVVGSQLDDLRCKAARTNAEAYYLAWVLSQIRQDVPVSVMGFSYGARVITGALHLSAGGELCGLALPDDAPRRTNVRAVLMAAALHNYWMRPGCFHGEALDATDRMLILANHCDKVLRRYHWLFKGYKPRALGVTGLSWHDQTGRVEELDCCCCVGETHDSLMYLNSPILARRARRYVLWSDVE